MKGLVLASVVATIAAAGWPTPADACGGFFCDSGVPVAQTGEHILFAIDGDEIETHVRVQYQGPSESFAWIVPTPSLPTVGISTPALFTALDRLTAPQFQVTWTGLGCALEFPNVVTFGAAAGGGDGGASDDRRRIADVTVVEQAQTGPYEYAILRATDAGSLYDWLVAHDYDLPPSTQAAVEPYVRAGGETHFVAFRLAPTSTTGDIEPVVLRYRGTTPVIPIQLTAVATQPDMGVTVNILSDARAVPQNYLHVHVNEAQIDWLRNGQNYDAIITRAMDEAGGQAFATEFAGSSSIMDTAIYDPAFLRTAYLATLTDPVEFFQQFLAEGFTWSADILDLWLTYYPLPAPLAAQGVSAIEFYSCLACYEEYILPEAFDGVGFAAALEETIVVPLRRAQELFDRLPYLTRLYTTLSAEEMTVDPIFVRNDQMADVDNVHQATAIVDCRDGGTSRFDAPVLVRLEDGREIVTRWSDDRVELDAMPAAELIEQTGAEGSPTVILDNRADIDAVLRSQRRSARIGSGCGGCSTPGSNSWPLAFLVGAWVFRRRT